MEQNVYVAVFNVESEGYQTLTEIKNTPIDEKSAITEAALVKVEGGKTNVLDLYDSGSHTTDDAAVGGLVGMCLGVLAGPLGVLFGAGYGAMVGMALDTADGLNEASMLEQIADKLDDGTVALIAMAYEQEEETLDKMLSKFDVVTARFDAAVVAKEVQSAREMQAELERQARLDLSKKKDEEFKKEVEDYRAEMTKKFKAFCDSIESDPNIGADQYKNK